MSKTPAAWRLILHHENVEKALAWVREHKRIAIGWGEIGHVRASGLSSTDMIRQVIKNAYGERLSGTNHSNGGRALYDFAYTMKPGDLVVLRGPGNRAVVRVRGEYEWAPVGEPVPSRDYNHQREIEFTNIDADSFWNERGGLGAGSRFCTLLPLAS